MDRRTCWRARCRCLPIGGKVRVRTQSRDESDSVRAESFRSYAADAYRSSINRRTFEMKLFRAGAGALLAISFFSTRSLAADPIMSGVYAMNYTSTCAEYVFTPTDPLTGDQQSSQVVFPGGPSTLIGLATFNPKQQGIMSFVGQSTGTGGLVQLSAAPAGTAFNSYSNAIPATAAPFSNSSTTINLFIANPTNPRFTAFYITNPSTNIATVVTFSQISESALGTPCVSSGYLAR